MQRALEGFNLEFKSLKEKERRVGGREGREFWIVYQMNIIWRLLSWFENEMCPTGSYSVVFSLVTLSWEVVEMLGGGN